jgi:glyoxylase-like metal-dependent hydrolase (beta-lactamase superfamily II)
MAEQVARGIFKLDIPLPGNPLKNLNSYLIRGQERSLLIDTGFKTRACLDAMKTELALLSVDMKETDIFITHMHADHVGLASELATACSRIFISAVDAAFLNSLELPETQDYLIASNVAEGFPGEEFMRFVNHNSAKGMVTSKHLDYACLEDGDSLSYGGYELVCILTPGHTPGHMCLYCQALKLMLLGDHVLFGITPNIVRWPSFENSLQQYLMSLIKIGSYDIDIALPAHRAVDCSVAERIRLITEHHHERLREVAGIVGRRPGLTAYDIAGYMHWDIQCDSWADFPLIQKWFAVGEALAHIDYLAAAGDIVREEQDGVRYYHPK